MNLFLAGVYINCIVIALIILSGIRSSLSYSNNNNSRNDVWHILGLVLAGVVAFSFYHKNNGNITIAKLIVWLPATPMLVAGVCMLVMMLLKPNWK